MIQAAAYHDQHNYAEIVGIYNKQKNKNVPVKPETDLNMGSDIDEDLVRDMDEALEQQDVFPFVEQDVKDVQFAKTLINIQK